MGRYVHLWLSVWCQKQAIGKIKSNPYPHQTKSSELIRSEGLDISSFGSHTFNEKHIANLHCSKISRSRSDLMLWWWALIWIAKTVFSLTKNLFFIFIIVWSLDLIAFVFWLKISLQYQKYYWLM